jgi:hypothetical protein
MLAPASIVVFITGLPGRPPTTQFPALPTEQDDGCGARRTTRGKIRFSGRYTLLRPEDTKSYLPRGPDMRQTCDLVYVKGTRGISVTLSSATHADTDPDLSYCVRSTIVLHGVHETLTWEKIKEKDFNSERIKDRINHPHNSQEILWKIVSRAPEYRFRQNLILFILKFNSLSEN